MLKIIFMNRIRKNSNWVFGLSLLLFACNGKPKGTVWEEHVNTLDFTSIEQVKTTSFALSEIMEIEEWLLSDTLLVCKNSSGNPYYYVINVNDFSVIGAFGHRGHGQNEWIGPRLVQKGEGGFCVLDNGRRAVYEVEKPDTTYSIHKLKDLTLELPLNNVKSIAYPICAYCTNIPNALVWNVGNIETLSVSDSISFVDENNEGKSIRYDFSYDVNQGYVVFAGLYIDRFMVARLDESNRLSHKLMFVGNGEEDMERKAYYTDVVCGDFIYLLSQRKMDLPNMSGTSQIEVYDYSGKPIKVINLDIVATNMVYDKHNKRFVFLSPSDNDLHVLDYVFE